MTIIVSVALSLLAILISVLIYSRRTEKPKDILLAGPSGSGKTAITFALLNTSANGRASTIPNVINHEGTRIVEIPGHERISTDTLKTHLPAKRVLYCMDYKHLNQSVQHLSGFLQAVGNTPVVIVLTKYDKQSQESLIQRSKNTLEFELNKIRKSKVDNDGKTIALNYPFVVVGSKDISNLFEYIH
ncbi:hypothetical protein E3Q02_01806 [Wallemia mellicola]|uniref:Signal recognition particle receptor subunit beta n=1 Tax=Wallemia mellicola TaxID=1708541 RepID=A0AB38MXF1_9BASI|nr:hypothetical protein E3Q02_01806 [Wallemia mellicola]